MLWSGKSGACGTVEQWFADTKKIVLLLSVSLKMTVSHAGVAANPSRKCLLSNLIFRFRLNQSSQRLERPASKPLFTTKAVIIRHFVAAAVSLLSHISLARVVLADFPVCAACLIFRAAS